MSSSSRHRHNININDGGGGKGGSVASASSPTSSGIRNPTSSNGIVILDTRNSNYDEDDKKQKKNKKHTGGSCSMMARQVILVCFASLLVVGCPFYLRKRYHQQHLDRKHRDQVHREDEATSLRREPTTEVGKRRQRILDVCGDLCDLSREIEPKSQFGYFGYSEANIDCERIFASDILDEPGDVPPPRTIPDEYLDDFQMNGRATIEPWYIQDVYLGKKAQQSVWSRETVEDWKSQALDGKFDKFGNYREIDRSTLLESLKYENRLVDKSVLVIGSETPWVEALCLAAGASNITTLEYGSITSKHEQIVTYTPSMFRKAYSEGKLQQQLFDVVVSYSSLEHSGLGRYGDALNPWGDIMSLARGWCVAKPGATLVLGMPSSGSFDKVYFNSGRVYGPERWPYLTTNWKRTSYSAGWFEDPQRWQSGPALNKRLIGPAGHEIYKNQSALIFEKVVPQVLRPSVAI